MLYSDYKRKKKRKKEWGGEERINWAPMFDN